MFGGMQRVKAGNCQFDITILLYWHCAALCGRRVSACFQAIIRSSRKNTCEIVHAHCVGIQRLVSVVTSDKVTTGTVALMLWIAKVTEIWNGRL